MEVPDILLPEIRGLKLIPTESVANLFLRILCRLSQRLLKNASVRKIPVPIKIKSALLPPQTQNTPPPPNPKHPPPQTRNFMDMGFLQKERIFPGAHKIGAAISGPRIADKHFTDTRIFLIVYVRDHFETLASLWAQDISEELQGIPGRLL